MPSSVRFSCQRLCGDVTRVQQAVLKTILYSDIFHYPLTPAEVHHFLVGCETEVATVQAALDAFCRDGLLVQEMGYVALADRTALFALRQQREAASAALWPVAERWAARMARVPYLRMVAVTGALAVNNVDERVDIDYLVVTVPGRLWLCRAFVIALVRAAAAQGVHLCPNYLITTQRLAFQPHTLFAAHDLTQMVPLFGQETYAQLWALNPWWRRFLPQAHGPLRQPPLYTLGPREAALKQASEQALAGRVGDQLEGWEFARKRRKFLAEAQHYNGTADPLAFDPDVCKGHFGGHGNRTLRAYEARLRAYGVLTEHDHAHRY